MMRISNIYFRLVWYGMSRRYVFLTLKRQRQPDWQVQVALEFQEDGWFILNLREVAEVAI